MPEVETLPVETTPKSDTDFQKFMQAVTAPIEEEKDPDQYRIILHNDPVTPFWIVVQILEEVWDLPHHRAEQVMMAAHTQGTAIVCVLPENDANERLLRARDMSKDYPLTFSLEKDD